MRSLLLVLLALAPPSLSSAAAIEFITVPVPGNVADPDTGFGAVAYDYGIGKFEVTNDQYVDFLNAVAATDAGNLNISMMNPFPNPLYNPFMVPQGVIRSGIAGAYTYAVLAGFENRPVTNLSFPDMMRFANWLHNGRPSGGQSAATTEDGAYTITTQGLDDDTVVRNGNALFALASNDEWYKAAYFDPGSENYFDYPAGSDQPIVCVAPTSTPNRANCENVVGDVGDVASYPGSPSPVGTFAQAGNAFEWTDSIAAYPFPPFSSGRIVRGTSRGSPATVSKKDGGFDGLQIATSYTESNDQGFRVVALPAPAPAALMTAALATVALLAHPAIRKIS